MDDLPDPLTPDTPCETALRRIVLHCVAEFAMGMDSVATSDDPRGPHKARVALRRLTSALDVFAPMLRRQRLAALRAGAKRVFRTLGALRDSDVHTEAKKDDPGHRDRLRRNAAVRAQVRHDLDRLKAAQFAGKVRVLVAADGDLWRRGPAARAMRDGPLGAYASGMLASVWADCQAQGRSVSAMPPQLLHDFRKKIKTMRYLAEFFGPLFPGLGQDPFRNDFRDIQDALGTLNDYEVALALDGRAPPKVLPAKQTRALVAAEAIWLRLTSAPVPWAAG